MSISDLCDLLTLLNMCQVVMGPTHTHHNGLRSTIDLVFVSKNSKVGSCETLPSLCNSDHYTQIEVRNSIQALSCKGRLAWRYNYADWSLACLIKNRNWEVLFSGDNIDSSWTSWHQHFLSIMKESIPNTALRCRRNLPWLNSGNA